MPDNHENTLKRLQRIARNVTGMIPDSEASLRADCGFCGLDLHCISADAETEFNVLLPDAFEACDTLAAMVDVIEGVRR